MILLVLRTIACLLPLAAAVALGGCGGHSSAVSGAPAAGTGVSKAQAQAYAHEVNLTAADIPEATILSQEHESGEPSAAGVEFARCAGGVGPSHRVANIDSADFRIGSKAEALRVKSSVEVMPTAALAAQNYTALTSGRGRECLKRLLPRTLEGASTGRARIGPATISPLPQLLAAGTASFGMRVNTTLTGLIRGKQVTLPLVLDVFDLLAGPAEVNFSVGSSLRPPPRALEQRLLSLLYTRAQTHKL